MHDEGAVIDSWRSCKFRGVRHGHLCKRTAGLRRSAVGVAPYAVRRLDVELECARWHQVEHAFAHRTDVRNLRDVVHSAAAARSYGARAKQHRRHPTAPRQRGCWIAPRCVCAVRSRCCVMGPAGCRWRWRWAGKDRRGCGECCATGRWRRRGRRCTWEQESGWIRVGVTITMMWRFSAVEDGAVECRMAGWTLWRMWWLRGWRSMHVM